MPHVEVVNYTRSRDTIKAPPPPDNNLLPEIMYHLLDSDYT
jgi:hypothetical protein